MTNAADKDFAKACREWIRGCTCAPPDSPQECTACTNAFLNAVLTRAKNHGLEIGANAIWADGFGAYWEDDDIA
jgi:hypothetical protein